MSLRDASARRCLIPLLDDDLWCRALVFCPFLAILQRLSVISVLNAPFIVLIFFCRLIYLYAPDIRGLSNFLCKMRFFLILVMSSRPVKSISHVIPPFHRTFTHSISFSMPAGNCDRFRIFPIDWFHQLIHMHPVSISVSLLWSSVCTFFDAWYFHFVTTIVTIAHSNFLLQFQFTWIEI